MTIAYKQNREDYWKLRKTQNETYSVQSQEAIARMRKVYKESLVSLEKEIQAFYGRYATENGLTLEEVHKRLNPSQLKSAKEEIKRYYDFADPKKIGREMSEKYRDELRRLSARAYMSRLEEIKARLRHVIVELGADENATLEDAMKGIYAQSHSVSSYELDRTLGYSAGYSAPDGDALSAAIHERWLGENFSTRIWQRNDKLLQNLQTDLLQGIAQGHGAVKIARKMAERYSVDYKNCERLVRTESAHIAETATAESYKEHGIDKYEFVATLEETTCPICGSLDGKTFDLKYREEGVNYPPMHPNCRCTTEPSSEIIDDLLQGDPYRIAYDEGHKIVKIPADMTFDEWKKATKQAQNGGKRTIETGGVLDKDAKYQKDYAERAYAEIKNRNEKHDIEKVAKNSGMSEEDVKIVRNHLFFEKHDLNKGHDYFDKDPKIALAWEALEQGRQKPNDVLLLKHELEEARLMKEKGYSYAKAHLYADLKFPWEYKVNPVTKDWSDDKVLARIKKDLEDLL